MLPILNQMFEKNQKGKICPNSFYGASTTRKQKSEKTLWKTKYYIPHEHTRKIPKQSEVLPYSLDGYEVVIPNAQL